MEYLEKEDLHEIFIEQDGHKRCTGCGEIVFNMTDDHIMVCPDSYLENFSMDVLPKDFNPDALPDGMCPDCKVFSETEDP